MNALRDALPEYDENTIMNLEVNAQLIVNVLVNSVVNALVYALVNAHVSILANAFANALVNAHGSVVLDVLTCGYFCECYSERFRVYSCSSQSISLRLPPLGSLAEHFLWKETSI